MLRQRKPMNRGKGFQRKHEPQVSRSEKPTAEARKAANMAALMAPSRALVKGTYAGSSSGKAAPKSPAPVRDEAYRRWVASLPCYECRIQGYSQCAHPNSGKAKSKKLSDDGCFPLCVDRLGVKGCHSRFDQYEIVSRADMPEYERQALEWTEQQKGLL